MPADDKPSTPQRRDDTDASLRAERTKTDDELAARARALQEDADAVIELARARAEVVLRAARARADAKMGTGQASSHAALERERGDEDRALTAEHASNDSVIAAERDLRRWLLADLLAHEREITDTALSKERVGADSALQSRNYLVAVVSHELRNLLSSVSLNASSIIDEAGSDASARRFIARAGAILRATARLDHVVSSLLDATSLEAGALALSCVRADAALVAREALELLAPLAADRGIRLEAALPSQPLYGMIDAARIVQVLTNLVINALKFTSASGVVSMRVSRAGDAIEFVVADTGCGIPADKLAYIFDRYSRASPERVPGYGLGLYISRQLVEAHGGGISVESQPGNGSTFRFTVPATD